MKSFIFLTLAIAALPFGFSVTASAQTVKAELTDAFGCSTQFGINEFSGEGAVMWAEKDGKKVLEICLGGNGSRKTMTLELEDAAVNLDEQNDLDLPFEVSTHFMVGDKDVLTCTYTGHLTSIGKIEADQDYDGPRAMVKLDYPNFDKSIDRNILHVIGWEKLTCPPLRSQNIAADMQVLTP